jgi:glucosyl-3-phosphoglycerate phosphatase
VSPARVIIWRHGRTTWNAERRFQGQADPPLDDVGRAQAAQAAALLATLRPSVIVTSDLQRAAQTADALGMICGLTPEFDARLRERSLGHWEGLTRDEVAARFPAELADWQVGLDVTSSRGGESRQQVAERSRAAFDELPGVETAIVVTHSATALSLTSDVLALPQFMHVLGPLANCHWTELQSAMADPDQGGRWRLRAHNAGPPGLVIPLPAVEPESPDAEAIDAGPSMDRL